MVAESKSRINFSKSYVYAALPVDANVEFQDDIMKITMGGSTCYIAADTRKKIEMYNLPKTPLSFFMYGFNAAGSGPACTPQSMTPGTVHG